MRRTSARTSSATLAESAGRRPSARANRGLRAAVAAVFGALLTAGCAAMPASGPVLRVDPPQGGAAENLQVRVFPMPPHKGDDPATLLAGFLDASNADDGYSIARSYLTGDAAKRWNPDAGVVVLDGNPGHDSSPARPREGDTSFTVSVTGRQVAQLDATHTYSVMNDQYQRSFTFVKETEGEHKGEWRIDQLPDGLIIDQTNFKNGYRPAHRYFYTNTDPSAPKQASSTALVPDPIYLRRRADLLTAATRALTDGPSDWLSPAVHSAFKGVQIKGGVTVDDSRVARVRVSTPDFSGQQQQQQCKEMADQLFPTLLELQGKGQLDRLELTGDRGSCSVSAADVAQLGPGSLAGSAGLQSYYQLDTGQLMLADPGDGDGKQVPGALGQPAQPNQPKLSQIAVRRDGTGAAAVSSDGKQLYVTGFAAADKLGQPVLDSHAPQPSQGLNSPTWDGRGNLFVADADPAQPRILMVRDHTVTPAQVDDLAGQTVRSLKVSSDGTRIALVALDSSGAWTLKVGVVVHGGTPSAPEVRIAGLRPVAPLLNDVMSVSWSDSDQLLVLGKEPDKLPQLQYVGTDGSQNTDSPLQGGESMTGVSATESRSGDQVPPVLAVGPYSQIYRLQNNQWRQVTTTHPSTSFSYPD